MVTSLTSYGRRVTDVVHFTIVSLLRQTYRPDMVILWLDNDNWNDDNIPEKLIELQKYGLAIKFCKDYKSYKKIVPALHEYPDALMVTCDDDLYYRPTMVERLIKAYEKDPSKIYAHRAHQMTFTPSGLDNYNDWPEEISDRSGVSVFPTSGGGTLYSKELLHEDICKDDLFMFLSPKADDVWLYFMGNLKHTINCVLPYKGYIYLPLDVIYQHFHSGSNLTDSNCGESMNDVQITAIMEYYNIKSDQLRD